jgi:hypothetical protein
MSTKAGADGEAKSVSKNAYPRVAWLEYFIRVPNGYEFADALASEGRIGKFHYVLTWHRAEFYPQAQIATVAEARAALEPLLDAWRVSAMLYVGPASLSFHFTDAAVENSAADESSTDAKRRIARPMPPKHLTLIYDRYPPVPVGLAVNGCVLDVSEHFFAAESNRRARLLHTYAIVTRIDAEHGGLGHAAKALNISVPCLKRMKHLASVRGVGVAARKYQHARPQQALSADEEQWLMSVSAEILLRCARLAAGRSPGRHVTRLG